MQIGDVAYFSTNIENLSMGQAAGEPQEIGTIGNIGTDQEGNSFIEINSEAVVNSPSENDFLMFSKSSIVNVNGLKGYFADVTMTNDSQDRAELFAVSSEVVESSK